MAATGNDSIHLPNSLFRPSLPSSWVESEEKQSRKVVLGICAMEKKARSKPMIKLTERLVAYGEFEVVIFGDECLINKNAVDWPIVDCLIAFHSDGYPLDKAIEYIHLRRPYMVNDVLTQKVLLDRRSVYVILRENGIETPPGLIFVNRDEPTAKVEIAEYADYIVIDEVKLFKPFVEKPVSGDDHNIYIYYPNWGGTRRLFRKVENSSSLHFPSENLVRRDGSFIYEALLDSATDIKAYTVGPNYVYAESRKSPTIDGVVERDANGKELRCVTRLNEEEIEISSRIVKAFGQNVCGFDILRHHNTSYVIDVNGWSFVKGSMEYLDQCASLIRQFCLLAPISRNKLALNTQQCEELNYNDKSATTIINPYNNSVLRAVCAVFRHGDRTPKQKLKLKTKDSRLIQFYMKSYHVQDPSAATLGVLKFKNKSLCVELCKILDAVLLDTSDIVTKLKIEEILFVFEREELGKLQIKPKFRKAKSELSSPTTPLEYSAWNWEYLSSVTNQLIDSFKTSHSFTNAQELESVELILKWGGSLTHAGEKQAQNYGLMFRNQLFLTHNPEKRSLFLSGLQAYSSDEERVIKSAKIFCETLLEVTELPANTLHFDANEILDSTTGAKPAMDKAKETIQQIVTSEKISYENADETPWSFKCFALLKNPRSKLKEVFDFICELCDQIDIYYTAAEAFQKGEPVAVLPQHKTPLVSMDCSFFDWKEPSESILCQKDALQFMKRRWNKLRYEFYDSKTDTFDTTKISDLYDCLKHDVLHHLKFFAPTVNKMYYVVKSLADFVIPQEYGIEKLDKLEIGLSIAHPLILRIITQLEEGFKALPACRTFLYFTSESHLHALRNTMVLSGLPSNASASESIEAMNINYFSHCVFRLYEDVSYSIDSEERFYVNVLFSPGAAGDPFVATFASEHRLPVLLPVPLSGRIPFSQFKKILGKSVCTL